MKDRILEILKNSNKALTVEDIDDRLNIKDIKETKEFLSVLNELEEDGEVYHSNKNKYMIFDNGPLKKGIIRMNKKGFGFVEVQGSEDIFISIDNINNAIHNDVVVVEILKRKEDGRLEGRIVRTIKRDLSTVVGEILFKKGVCTVVPDDNKLKIELVINTEDENLGLVDGHKVIVKVDKLLEKGKYLCSLDKIIGHKNDPGVDILSIVYNYEIKDTFDEETIAELDNIPEEVSEEEKKGRRDLTGEVIFTIDGDDTKDIDDAISIEKLENGHYKLGVHIADVSYYVKEGSALDNEAMMRGTSVYLVDRVIPMLPHKLSNGICSLNPNVERLAMSCVMEIDENGKTVDYEIFESLIKSRIQMTYKKANQVIEEDIIPEGYEEYADKLKLMNELSLIIRKEKNNRGYIDFDVKEAKILVDEKCHPTDIILRNRGRGENIIEDFMICANECVATHIFYMTLPFIYRVHEYPKEEKIREYLSYLQTMGITVNANIKDVSPKSMQRLLYGLKKEKHYQVLSTQLLRSMQKAVYMPQNLGHYGLASKCYTHFTSPIRRYPDTTVHRLLRTYLFNNDMSPETLKKWEEKLVFIADNSSQKERESIDCERDVESMKMAEYMEDHIGEEFEGMVSGVANFGMFVQLDNLVEGLIHISEMKDFFHYDDVAQTLTGERTKQRYRLGDRLLVKVIRACKEEKAIDFELVKKLDGEVCEKEDEVK
ncbi:MAG: ribonuclease R [Bacilli bacterium]|nr:ribonuclease R [Bacilli bacterium]